MGSLKVIHVVSSTENEASGPSYSVVRLFQSLAKDHDNISLYSLANATAHDGHRLYFKRSNLFYKFGFSWDLLVRIWRSRGDGEKYIFHSHGLWMFPNLVMALLASNSRHILAPRGTLSVWAFKSGNRFFKQLIWGLLQKKIVMSAYAIHVTSALEAKEIRALGYKGIIENIPNGVDVLGKPSYEKELMGSRRLLFLSRIHEKKNVRGLIDAWKVLSYEFPDWSLDIYGPLDSEYASECQDTIDELGLTRVKMRGPVFGAEKSKVFSSAALFILPSFSENFGMVIAEAMSVGTPVVVTRDCGWEHLSEQTGGIVSTNDTPSLIRNLSFMMSKCPSELHAIGSNGYNYVVEELSWSKLSVRMYDLYKQISADM